MAGDLLLAFLEQLRHPVAEPGPLERGHRSQAVLGRLGRLDRVADVVAGALGHPADQLAGCGGAELDRIQLALAPVATDAERDTVSTRSCQRPSSPGSGLSAKRRANSSARR